MSIFGTQLSAITFMAIPAKAFATDWVYFLLNVGILLMGSVVVYAYLPFMVLPIYASLEGLNPALLEAATDMGATPIRRFFRVILPLTKGGVFAGTILVFIPALGDYLVPTFLGGSKVMMVGNLVTHKYITAGDIPGGSAFGVVLTAILILVLFIIIKKGGEDALEKVI